MKLQSQFLLKLGFILTLYRGTVRFRLLKLGNRTGNI